MTWNEQDGACVWRHAYLSELAIVSWCTFVLNFVACGCCSNEWNMPMSFFILLVSFGIGVATLSGKGVLSTTSFACMVGFQGVASTLLLGRGVVCVLRSCLKCTTE